MEDPPEPLPLPPLPAVDVPPDPVLFVPPFPVAFAFCEPPEAVLDELPP